MRSSGTLTIGRGRRTEVRSEAEGSTCAIADELLSREHLRICARRLGYFVEDLGSRNGSQLDGRSVCGSVRLGDGSILSFGNQIAVCRKVSDAARLALRQELETPFGPIPTLSPSLALTLARLRRLVPTGVDLLLVGEAGVGKGVYARSVHQASGRRGRFRALECASSGPELLESELEAADRGTLLLDDIADLPRELQARMFRFLRDRTITAPRSRKPRRVDVRIIGSATRIDHGDFSCRLGGDPALIPPLRDRPEDVAGLLAHFAGRQIEAVEPSALRALALYGWPLNVRELETATRNAISLCDDGLLRLEHLPAVVQAAFDRGPVVTARRRSPRAAPERAQLEQLLQLHKGNVSNVAKALDRKWPVVWRWLVRLGIRPDTFRKPRKR